MSDFPVAPVKWIHLSCDHSGENVYAATEENSEGGLIFTSEDKGRTFVARSSLGMKPWSGLYPQNWGDRFFFTAYDDPNIYYTKDVGATFSIAGQMPRLNSTLCVSFEQYGGGFIYTIKPGEYIYKSFDKGSTFHADVSSGKRQWQKCLMTAFGTFDIVSVYGVNGTNEDAGLWTDKADTSPLTLEQIGYPFRHGGPFTDDNNLLSEVATSMNGSFIIAGFGNAVDAGDGVFISKDRGESWRQTNLDPRINRFEEQGMAINENGTIIAVIGFSEDPIIPRKLYVSSDSGGNWTTHNETLHAQYVASSNTMEHIFATIEPDNEELQKGQVAISHDMGKSFNIIQLNYSRLVCTQCELAHSCEQEEQIP